MKQGRRDIRGGRRRDIPLAAGLIVSALVHLLIVLLNPAMIAPGYGGGRAGRAPAVPPAQFAVLSLSPRDGVERVRVESVPSQATVPARPSSAPGAAPVDGRETGAEGNRERSIAERLRYNTRPFSPPVAPERETEHQRAVREAGERLLKAAAELGPLPPNGVSPRRASSGLGVSIPFGFKPPPPAQTVPAPPLPDSILRRDSMRAAIRETLRRDSIRAARSDTMKLKNVAPRKRFIIPRVRPDTTVSGR